MTESLRRQLVVPPHVSALHTALGLGMVGLGVALLAAPESEPVVATAPAIDLAIDRAELAPAGPATAVALEAEPIADTIQLAFTAGGRTYLRLADLPRGDDGTVDAPPRGTVRYLREGDANVALAEVRADDLPAGHRAWIGKQVIVDGGCRATVDGFALVSRTVGDPDYAGLQKDAWDAASVLRTGVPMLAARLDRCSGTFARDAALAPVVFPTVIADLGDKLAGVARSALIASAAGTETGAAWDAARAEGQFDHDGPWWKAAELTSRVVRHPRTGATLVTIHARADYECGGPDINVWGVYRAAADGTLTPVVETRLEAIRTIEQVIDVDGDGELEVIGRPWLGFDVVLADQAGAVIDRLDLPFFGCPC